MEGAGMILLLPVSYALLVIGWRLAFNRWLPLLVL